jgi:hypothetical protein
VTGSGKDYTSRLRPLRTLWWQAFAGAVAVAGALLAGCSHGDCLKGQSSVELRLPPGSGWVLEEYCVDDECLPAAGRRQIAHDERYGQPQFYSYGINVRDRPDTYHYRVKLTAPDGRSLVHDGEVGTQGNRMGGELCKPTSVSASLIVGSNGTLTTQSP